MAFVIKDLLLILNSLMNKKAFVSHQKPPIHDACSWKIEGPTHLPTVNVQYKKDSKVSRAEGNDSNSVISEVIPKNDYSRVVQRKQDSEDSSINRLMEDKVVKELDGLVQIISDLHALLANDNEQQKVDNCIVLRDINKQANDYENFLTMSSHEDTIISTVHKQDVGVLNNFHNASDVTKISSTLDGRFASQDCNGHKILTRFCDASTITEEVNPSDELIDFQKKNKVLDNFCDASTMTELLDSVDEHSASQKTNTCKVSDNFCDASTMTDVFSNFDERAALQKKLKDFNKLHDAATMTEVPHSLEHSEMKVENTWDADSSWCYLAPSESQEFILPDKTYEINGKDVTDANCKNEKETVSETVPCIIKECHVKLNPLNNSALTNFSFCSSDENTETVDSAVPASKNTCEQKSSSRKRVQLGAPSTISGRVSKREKLALLNSVLRKHEVQSNKTNHLAEGKNFPKRHFNSQQEQTRARSKKFLCTHCGKKFSWKSHLTVHERIHLGSKPFACTYCNKQFTDKANCTKHERIHTGEKRYSCQHCNKKFTHKSDCTSHEKVHAGDEEKRHSCSHCDKKFARKGDCTKHERVHTGEKPYSCSHCGKKFAQISHCIKHERTHTGEKLYVCRYCEKKFTQQSNLMSHERIHTGEKPYSCSYCEMKFVDKSNCTRHERIHTRDEVVVLIP